MKKTAFLCITILLIGFCTARAQSDELIQLGLNIEKLNQFRQILTDMRRGYAIVSQGYSTVRNLTQGNFRLHEVFLDGLMAVSPAVARYRRIADIIRMQQDIIEEYRSALRRFRRRGIFSAREIGAIERVYSGLFDGSVKNLEELLLVVTANKLRMSDAERLDAIDRIFGSMKEKQVFLRQYNTTTGSLARQRELQLEEIQRMTGLMGH
jgi:hypothetical protein